MFICLIHGTEKPLLMTLHQRMPSQSVCFINILCMLSKKIYDMFSEMKFVMYVSVISGYSHSHHVSTMKSVVRVQNVSYVNQHDYDQY